MGTGAVGGSGGGAGMTAAQKVQLTAATALVALIGGSVSGYLANLGAHGPLMQNYPVAYTVNEYKGASTSMAKTLLTLTANQKIGMICVRVATAFAGTGVTSMVCSVGTSTTNNKAVYAPEFSVMQTSGSNCLPLFSSATDLAEPDSSLNVVLHCRANTNFGNGSATVLTQGSLTVAVQTVDLPALATTGIPGVSDGGQTATDGP